MNKTFTLKETLQKVNQMYHDGWCDGCVQDPDECIRTRQPKCLIHKEEEDGKKSV